MFCSNFVCLVFITLDIDIFLHLVSLMLYLRAHRVVCACFFEWNLVWFPFSIFKPDSTHACADKFSMCWSWVKVSIRGSGPFEKWWRRGEAKEKYRAMQKPEKVLKNQFVFNKKYTRAKAKKILTPQLREQKKIRAKRQFLRFYLLEERCQWTCKISVKIITKVLECKH